MSPMPKEAVIDAIWRAFGAVTRPSLDDFVHCEQCEIFVGRLLVSCPANWNEISSYYSSHESSALNALTPLSWQFLLPAYMTWHLQNYNQRKDSSTVGTVVWNLVWDEPIDEHNPAGFRTLYLEQVRTVD